MGRRKRSKSGHAISRYVRDAMEEENLLCESYDMFRCGKDVRDTRVPYVNR